MFESGENPDLDNRKRKEFLSMCSAKTTARDAVLTLKYAWCFPLSKTVFIVWIQRSSPEKSNFFVNTIRKSKKKYHAPFTKTKIRALPYIHRCDEWLITLSAYIQHTAQFHMNRAAISEYYILNITSSTNVI